MTFRCIICGTNVTGCMDKDEWKICRYCGENDDCPKHERKPSTSDTFSEICDSQSCNGE